MMEHYRDFSSWTKPTCCCWHDKNIEKFSACHLLCLSCGHAGSYLASYAGVPKTMSYVAATKMTSRRSTTSNLQSYVYKYMQNILGLRSNKTSDFHNTEGGAVSKEHLGPQSPCRTTSNVAACASTWQIEVIYNDEHTMQELFLFL